MQVSNICILYRELNSLALSLVKSLSVLSLCMFKTMKTVRLLVRYWYILERSHVFSFRGVEKGLLSAAPVVAFTKISLHNVLTSIFWVGQVFNFYSDFVKTRTITFLQQQL